MLAMTAGRIEPWHSDPVAFLDDLDTCPDRSNATDRFVTRNERKLRLQWPIARRGMEVGVTYAAGFGLDQDLARAR
jgi:hypothetical protein